MLYLKKADKSAASNALEAQKVVHDMLANIDKDGEQAVRNLELIHISEPTRPY